MTDAIKVHLIGFIGAMIVLGIWCAIAVFVIGEINQIETNRINIEKLKEATHD